MGAMLAAALLATTLGLCDRDVPGPSCPGPGVPHAMLGVVEGKRVEFTGWHNADGSRHYDPTRTPERLMTAATNYGVDLPRPAPDSVTHGPTLRTNDRDFGERWNAEREARELSIGRPCPGPEPCPNPTPRLPEPQREGEFKLAYIVAACFGVATFVVILGALLVALVPSRKA